MKRTLIMAVCTAFVTILVSCSGNKSKDQSAGSKEVSIAEPVADPISKEHVNIPNSHLYIIPPAGFVINEAAGTLGTADGYAHFMMMNILSGYTPEKYFNELKTQADKDFPGSWKEESITINGHPAFLCIYKTAAFNQIYLAFTDGSASEMVIGNFEDAEAVTGKAMYEAMKTVVVRN